jgi:elongator complex protein 3
MMPGLPGSSPKIDLEVFKELFSDPHFRPDYLKIYPTLVVEGTELFRLYQRGDYVPLLDDEAAELVSRIKEILPEYVRLQRVQRDIPSQLIAAGVKKSNLRQIAKAKLLSRGGSCRCIRCREAGLCKVQNAVVTLHHQKYSCCEGIEHFLSIESDEGILVGFLRLRLSDAARVRELHVYGPMVPLGKKNDDNAWQHKGYGTKLLRAAEAISEDSGYKKLHVTSGIGARGYYRQQGYELDGVYMTKKLGRTVDKETPKPLNIAP